MVLSTVLKKMLIGRAFTNEQGRIRLFRQMDWTLVPSEIFAEILQHIGESEGAKYLYQLGYKQGIGVATEMIKHMGLKPKGGWAAQNAIIAMLEFIGFGKIQFVRSDVKPDGHHHMIVHVKDHPVVEHASKRFGPKSLVCNWFMGVYAAHGEMELGLKNTKVKETKCLCKGAPFCIWETRW